MAAVSSIQFTQDQMRTLTGVSAETIRHWRKTIPYLASKTGKAARFSFSDLLGLAVTNEIVGSLGVHVGSVSVGVDTLFKMLSDSTVIATNGAIVYLTSDDATLREPESRYALEAPTEPTLAIPLAPLIARLQKQMLPVLPGPAQAQLPFPPDAVRSRA